MFRYFSLTLLSAFLAASSGFAARRGTHHPKTIHAIALPKVGTQIVTTYFVTDSTGALVPKTTVDPKIDDDTLRVILSGVRMLGRADCALFDNLTSRDTTVVSYTANGDIYMRQFGKDTVWTRLPFGLAAGKVLRKKLPNDTATFLLHHFNMPHMRTWQVLGMDTASAGGKVYRCVKLLIDDIKRYDGKDWEQGMRYWYSPELGYFVRMNFGWDGPYFLNQQIKEFRVP